MSSEQGAPNRLRVGLIAHGEGLASLGPILQASQLVCVCGQAGMPQAAALADIPWVDDQRVLISQPDLQALLLATAPRLDVELAAIAAQRGLPVWRLPPAGRTFVDASEVVGQARQAASVYRVASWWEHVLDHLSQEGAWPERFEPVYSEAFVSASGPPANSWRASAADAAGGALATDGYRWLEALVAVRGLPETVSATIGHVRPEFGAVGRESEDTAAVILRFPDGGFGLVRAAWDLPPAEQRLLHHGPTATITLNDDEFVVVGREGTPSDRRPMPGDFLAGELIRFVEAVRGSARDRAAVPFDRHVAVSALLETIYLAARTGHPESPRKLYEVQGRTVWRP